jgi:hypothetical protein
LAFTDLESAAGADLDRRSTVAVANQAFWNGCCSDGGFEVAGVGPAAPNGGCGCHPDVTCGRFEPWTADAGADG